ncbi:expressed unknown protein [Seminavis robusta]|uniref:CRAL-TRIO domain-containing protein n=1 Tax=Seminavis robusta TaxID=568900 RepID=A0A9N8EC21_9STRA|nr:expressed unknown protein [Seminavis robusta]|eukprot:Sro927_g221100.1 n/a (365) ;mRNA; r:2340-3434
MNIGAEAPIDQVAVRANEDVEGENPPNEEVRPRNEDAPAPAPEEEDGSQENQRPENENAAPEEDDGNEENHQPQNEDAAPAAEEDDANEENQQQRPVPPPVDRSIDLTNQERQWARTIKAAIESCPDLDKLSDFEYCQLAIIDQGNVGAAVDRAVSLQGFRQEYDIPNTLEDALVALRNHVLLMPQLFLFFDYNHSSGGYTLIEDMRGCDLQILRTEKGWKTHVAGLYYMLHAMGPDFHSIRTGITYVFECDRFSLASNLDFKITKKVCTDVFCVYPFTTHKLNFFHTGLFANMLISSCRTVLPKSIASKFHVGCVFPDGRLSQFYNTPDPQTAMERTIGNMQKSVRRRYAMQAAFQVDCTNHM